jgi:hypothetical protein
MIDIDLVKLHLRMELNDLSEDVYLQHLIDSALESFCVFTNRTLVAAGGALPDPLGSALNITKSIEHGALLLIGHWYLNRETVVVGVTGAEVPLATERLWLPYRWNHF